MSTIFPNSPTGDFIPVTTAGTYGNAVTTPTVTSTPLPNNISNGIIGSINLSNIYSVGSGGSWTPSSVITLSNNGKEIVRMNTDGTVTWAEDYDIDAAAEAFGRSLTYSAELKAGITRKVKTDMRDSVFEDLINIARDKGSLTADDLTYLLEASKIIEKLKTNDEKISF